MHFVKAKSILSARGAMNEYCGMNIYRGCTHGCIYCDSRSSCYQFSHSFEDIEVKENAPELLDDALRRKRKKCMIGTGAMCDPYIHCEGKLRLTRRCLEIIERYGFGAAVQTKSDRVLGDIDVLDRINRKSKAVVQMTMTTFDEELCRILEPNVSTTRERFETLMQFKAAGIPTVVWICPILPYINDTEENIRGLMDYCVRSGVKGIINFGMGLTLRQGSREYFYSALDRHFPGMKEKYIKRYGNDYEIPSENTEKLNRIMYDECEKHGIMLGNDKVFSYLGEFPQRSDQLSIF